MKQDYPCAHCGLRIRTTKARHKAHSYCRRGYCVESRGGGSEKQWRAARPWLEGAEWLNVSLDPKFVRWGLFRDGVEIGVDDGLPVVAKGERGDRMTYFSEVRFDASRADGS